MKGPLGFCQLMANKKNTNTQWNNFLRLQRIQRRLIRISLPHPSPSFPFPSPPCNTTGLAVTHTHVKSSSFKGQKFSGLVFRGLIRIPLPYPSPSFLPLPSPPCNTTGLAVTHTHVRSSSFKVEFTFSASPMASAPSFPNPFHARFKDLMVKFSCKKQEQCITL